MYVLIFDFHLRKESGAQSAEFTCFNLNSIIFRQQGSSLERVSDKKNILQRLAVSELSEQTSLPGNHPRQQSCACEIFGQKNLTTLRPVFREVCRRSHRGGTRLRPRRWQSRQIRRRAFGLTRRRLRHRTLSTGPCRTVRRATTSLLARDHKGRTRRRARRAGACSSGRRRTSTRPRLPR